jgi:hypothetical protein
MQDPIMQFFKFDHLPPHLQEASRPFSVLALHITLQLPRNPEQTVALRKLLEAKDAAVRARIYEEPDADGLGADVASIPPDDREPLTEEEVHRLYRKHWDKCGGMRAVAAEAYRIRSERPIEVTEEMVVAAIEAKNSAPGYPMRAAICAAIDARKRS